MGHSQSGGTGPLIHTEDLEANVSARYHRLPKKVDDDYDVDPNVVLGTGMNGSVFMAKKKIFGTGTEGITCAVKPIDLENVASTARQDLQREVEVFLSMDHPHVARLIDVYEDSEESRLLLVMECCQGGELLGRVMKQKRYKEEDAAHAIWQILLAINYVHAREIVHRDVKLENFLYERPDNDHLKLIDFGFSKVFHGHKALTTKAGGTLNYAAPEVFEERFTTQCDIWSVGVVAFILLLGYMPFSEPGILKSISTASYLKKPEKWDAISVQAREFIESLLVADPSKRLTARQALKHPFIANRDQTGRRYITPLATLDGDASAKLNVSDDILNALCSYAHTSRFRRAILSLVSWCLTVEERAEVRDAFIELDVKREGVISLFTLKQILTNRFKFGNEKAGDIVESLSNHHGDEDFFYSDFLGAMVNHRIKIKEDHFLGLFRRFDKDNTGTITQENLTAVLGHVFDKKEIFIIVQTVDPTGSGKISYSNFLDYLAADDSTTGHYKTVDAGEGKVTSRRTTMNNLMGFSLTPSMKAGLNDKFKGVVVGESANSKSRACVVL